jgi:hypothetical protein
VLCLRPINVDSDPNFEDSEIEVLLNHFGEEKVNNSILRSFYFQND